MTRGLTPKRALGALLFFTAAKLTTMARWCERKSLKMFGLHETTVESPPAMEMAGGCLHCGSMFAVKSEYEAHKCPKRSHT